MGNLAFGSQKPEKIAPKLEEHLRKEIGATSPIPFAVEGGAEGPTIGNVLANIGKQLFGGRPETIFTVSLDCAAPRPFKLQMSVDRQGVGAHVGGLLYSTTLSKNIAAEVELEAPKTIGSSKFTGDPEAIGKLNAKGDLLKHANKFSRVKSEIGGLTLKIPRFFKIIPQDGGALLVVNTLGEPKMLGFKVLLGAKEFAALAAEIEAAI